MSDYVYRCARCSREMPYFSPPGRVYGDWICHSCDYDDVKVIELEYPK